MVRLLRHAAVAMLVGLLLVPATSHAAARSVSTSAFQRNKAANIAVSKVRSPYHPGAAGPKRFDCSGLVAYAFRLTGKQLAGRSSFELWNTGVRIRRQALRRGDLVWTWDKSLGHVGIYLGRGRYVHAPGKGRRVEIAPLPKGPAFIGAVRP